jgi:hypothetical protein
VTASRCQPRGRLRVQERRVPGPVTENPTDIQHIIYGRKVIVATEREAAYVLDEILGNRAGSGRPEAGRRLHLALREQDLTAVGVGEAA